MKIALLLAPLAIAAFAGSACAMSSPTRQLIDCNVLGGEKLPADSGGSAALCAAIERFAASDAPGRRFSVEVRVLGRSTMAATLTVANRKTLPEQKFHSSDRAIGKGSLERFAKALVGEVARADSR